MDGASTELPMSTRSVELEAVGELDIEFESSQRKDAIDIQDYGMVAREEREERAWKQRLVRDREQAAMVVGTAVHPGNHTRSRQMTGAEHRHRRGMRDPPCWYWLIEDVQRECRRTRGYLG